MAKKSRYVTPDLDLKPEAQEVLSRDFNLFYRPEEKPLPAGLKEFASALDSFSQKENHSVPIQLFLKDHGCLRAYKNTAVPSWAILDPAKVSVSGCPESNGCQSQPRIRQLCARLQEQDTSLSRQQRSGGDCASA